ncbi:hypothetical protein JCM11491_003868 [Sporobolomyces phaffii]
MVAVTPVYISTAASRNNASASRNSDGLVVFASGHLVSLWHSANDANEGVHATLPGHGGPVSALKFVTSDDSAFVSGDATGTAKLWTEQHRPGHPRATWQELSSLDQIHRGSVSAVEALALGNDEFLVVTGGSDATIRISTVSRATRTATHVQTIDCRGKIPLEVALSHLPDSNGLVLAVGSTENRIQLYTCPPPRRAAAGAFEFSKSLALEGHTDWIRCLSFTTPVPISSQSSSSSPHASTTASYDMNPGEVLLASGGQDNYIRLWRFTRLSRSTTTTTTGGSLSKLDELEHALLGGTDAGTTTAAGRPDELRVKAHDFVVAGDGEFSCSSEAVLLGHDAWVTGLNWAPSEPDESDRARPLRLLSASADRSMILWTPLDAATDVTTSARTALWTSVHRFGEFSSVTNLGFFGALWGRRARSVMASGWGGSWHVWTTAPAAGDDDDDDEWTPRVATTGHSGRVSQVGWEPEGQYLLSASHDMSTRLHAPWRRTTLNREDRVETWHELGRPQIHGYPLSSIAFLDRLRFVSGADEKLVRVFDAPQNFVDSFAELAGVGLDGDDGSRRDGGAARPMAANVPPLGLSNRAIASQAEADQLRPASSDPFDAVAAVDLSVLSRHPPLEEQLLGSTLWPETEKLYGHAFELVAIAAAHTRPLIATACRATLPSHALVRLYDTDAWRPVAQDRGGVLEGHALTVTKLEFSRDDEYLLSVGRDRSWRVYQRLAAGDGHDDLGYELVASMDKAHARIIWDACWSTDGSFFATASRDKTTKIWTRTAAATTPESAAAATAASSGTWTCAHTIKFDAAACTSVATTPTPTPTPSDSDSHLVAIGLENGAIHVYAVSASASEVRLVTTFDPAISHVLAVTTLSFCPPPPRPRTKDEPESSERRAARLASGSEDKSVRIFDIEL